VREWHLGGVDNELLQSFSTGHVRDLFQEAWFNLITLQQPDYETAFSCCSGRYIVADGIMMSYKLAKAHLTYPWAAPVGAPKVVGSRFGERLLIPQKALRTQLLSFCGGVRPPRKFESGSGLPRHELRDLKRQLRTQGLEFLLHLLDGHVAVEERCYVRPKVCALLAGTIARACRRFCCPRHSLQLAHIQALASVRLPRVLQVDGPPSAAHATLTSEGWHLMLHRRVSCSLTCPRQLPLASTCRRRCTRTSTLSWRRKSS